jgi:hypothetical protein
MNATVYKSGYVSGMAAFSATVSFVIAQSLQSAGLLEYPWDEILIYGTSLCIVIPFILLILCVHYTSPNDKKIWSHAAVIFSVIYGVFVIANYVVQLTTVIPMTLKGRSNEIQMLIQTPHSLFWDFDAIGYIFMGFVTLFLIPVYENKGFEKKVRQWLIAHFLTTPIIGFVYFYWNFSPRLLFIGFVWGVTAPGFMLFLALLFRNRKDELI